MAHPIQGFVSRVLTLYKEEEEEEEYKDCAPLYGYRRMRSSMFTFHSSVAQYTTLFPRRRHIKIFKIKFLCNYINIRIKIPLCASGA